MGKPSFLKLKACSQRRVWVNKGSLMPRPMVAESLPIKPVRLILGVIACIGIVLTLLTLLFGFTSIPANSVGVKTRFGAYHDLANPGLAYAIPYVDQIHIVPTQRLLKL